MPRHCTKHRLIFWFCIYIASALPWHSQAQQKPASIFGLPFNFEIIEFKEDISQSIAYDVCQDHEGFIWFATINGLYRYDGYKIKMFRFDPANPNSLSNNLVWATHVDRYGSIWVATEGGGLNRFDKKTQNFTRFSHDAKDEGSLSNNFVRDIYESEDGLLYIATDHGLNIISLDSIYFGKQPPYFHKIFAQKESPSGLSDNEIRALCGDTQGNVWAGTDMGLNKIAILSMTEKNASALVQQYFHQPTNPQSIGSNRIWDLNCDSRGQIWIGTDGGGLCLYQNEHDNFRRFMHSPSNNNSICSDYVVCLHEDSKQRLWIGTDGGGISILDMKTFNFESHQNKPLNPKSLRHNVIRSIFEDHSGAVWIGTNGGVNKYSPWKNQFAHVNNNPLDPNSLSHNEVRGFLQTSDHSKQSLWITTDGGGLNHLDLESGQIIHYKSDPKDPYSISDNVTLGITKDSKGFIWVGTYTGGVNRFKPSKDQKIRFKHYQHHANDPSSLSVDFVRAIYEDKKQTIWLCTSGGGLNKYHPDKDNFVSYRHNPSNPASISNDAIMFAFEDSHERFWIGTWGGGLNLMDREKESFKAYQYNSSDSNSISDNKVICIFEGSQGELWLGTTGGLNCFYPDSNKFVWHLHHEGRDRYEVYGILDDEHGNLWLSTNNGLIKYNPITKKHQRFTENHGLQGNNFFLAVHYQLENGMMLFGGMNGFNAFHPDSIRVNPIPPQVAITKLQAGNKDIDIKLFQADILSPGSIHQQPKEIRLNHKDKMINLEFAALHFVAPENNEFAYKLEGYDDEWNYVGTRRYVSYTNLPYKKLTFNLKASNCDGVWNEVGTKLIIHIDPPFWLKSHFKISAVLVFIIVAYGLYYWKINQERKISQLLEKKVKQRTKEIKQKNKELKKRKKTLEESNAIKDKLFSIVAHDLKNPFSSMNGLLELLHTQYDSYSEEKKKKIIRIAHQSSNQYSDVLMNLLNWARSQQGNLKPVFTELNIAQLIRNNMKFLDNLALEKSIEFNTDFENDIIWHSDENILNTILRNILSNAIKYSHLKGMVLISCSTYSNYLEISIIDHGIGITEENIKKLFKKGEHFSTEGTAHEKGTGLGLMVCHEFATVLGGKLTLQSEANKGTSVKLILPNPSTK